MWALWGPRPDAWRRLFIFLLGAALGVSAGYLDLPFLALDLAFLLALGWKTRRGRTLAAVSFVIVFVAASIAPFPAPFLRLLSASAGGGREVGAAGAITWLVLGLLGEAQLPFPWLLLAGLALPGFALGAHRFLRVLCPRPFAFWLSAVTGLWLLSAFAGVGHPRYSLLLWLLGTVALTAAWKMGRLARVAAALAVAQLLLSLGLAVRGDFFLKGDLDTIPSSACDALAGGEEVDLLLVPYPRILAQLRERCRPNAPLVGVRNIRHYPGAEEQLAPLRRRLLGARHVALVTYSGALGSLLRTRARVLDLLEARCVLETTTDAVRDPHHEVRLWSRPAAPMYRYRRTDWVCGE